NDCIAILQRHKLPIPPHRARPATDLITSDPIAHPAQVVADEERPAVVLAHLGDLIDGKVFLATRAFEMGRERRQAARSIFAPRARRRVSSSSYPRSICSIPLMTLVPFAQSVAESSAMPARMSGLRISAA